MDNINIYDYKNISVDKEYTQLNQEEIETIIYMDFTSNNYYKLTDNKYVQSDDIVLIDIISPESDYCCYDYYYEVGSNDLSEAFDSELLGKKAKTSYESRVFVDEKNLDITVNVKGIYVLQDINDENCVMEFYGYETMDEALDFIRKRASDEIVYNYAWDLIKEKSEIYAFPDYIEKEMQESVNSVSDSEISLDELKQSVYDYYYELVLAEYILEKEGVAISEKMKTDYLELQSEKNNISVEEYKQYVTEEEIYFQTVMYELKKILISYVKIN